MFLVKTQDGLFSDIINQTIRLLGRIPGTIKGEMRWMDGRLRQLDRWQ